MRVLHIISSSGMYGAERVILNLSGALNDAGHSSILAVFANLPHPSYQLYKKACADGIESHLITCKGPFDRRAFRKIRDIVSKTQVDLVHAHGYKADIYTYLALRRSHIPLVSTCHTWYDTDLSVRVYGAADRFILRRYEHVVAVSKDVRQRLLRSGIPEGCISLIRNGIDLRPYNDSQLFRDKRSVVSRPVVGLVGRLAWEKGIDLFLQVAAEVLRVFPSARFLVVGEGPDRGKLETQRKELNIEDSVEFLGHQDDMQKIYASFDILVSSSRQEGLPMGILEAMARGLPVVATAVGEVPTLVRNDETGVLVEPEGGPPLVAAIIDLLQEPEKRIRLGDAARRLVSLEYSAERMSADYLRVYEELLEPAGGRVDVSATQPTDHG